jgi:hypothetical protein
MFPQAFTQDFGPAQAKVMAATQKPTSQSILAEKSGPPAWKQLPTWYQVSDNDRIIPSAAEQMFAKQMNATTVSPPSSHASPVSHPNEIAQLILNATKAGSSGGGKYVASNTRFCFANIHVHIFARLMTAAIYIQ